jgi:EAL domain-containing protein (putative c-di-GMP-specific phosphodiesterase class I)
MSGTFAGRLTAYDIRMMLLELEIAERHREHAATHATSIDAVRQALLRAAVGDVEVETEEEP